MPQIHEYTAPEGLGLRPTETGIESTAAAARRVGGAYSEIAQLKKETGQLLGSGISFAGQQATEYLERKELARAQQEFAEISRGAAAYAGLSNAKTKQWHDTNSNADPNDPTVAQNFQSSLEADLDKFKSGFLTRAGQQWAQQHAEGLREHMFHKTTADRATAAGHAAKINANTTVQGLANGAMWAGGDELAVKQALKDLGTSGLPKSIIDNEGRNTIIDRAIHGYIQKNGAMPDWVKKDEYKGYVDARDISKMEADARRVRQDNETAAKRERQQAEFQNKEAFNKEANTIYRDTLPVNNESRPQLPADINERMKKLQPNDDAPEAIQKGYRSLVKHVNAISDKLNKPEPLATTSHRAVVGLIGRIRSGDITEQGQIDDVYNSGTLTSGDYNFARKEFYERKTDDGVTLSHARGDFWRRAERSIDPGMTALGERSALGDQQVHKAMMAARQQEEALRAKGLNPQLTYDERSEYFFGKPENLRQYAVSLQQTNDYNAAIRRGDVPQAPGAPVAPTQPAPAIPRPNVGPVQPSLRPGDVYRGNEYLGGPKDDPASWRRVGAPSAPLSR